MIEPFVCHGCSTSRRSFEARCGHCGAERPRGGWAVHPHIGDTIADRYRILSALGRGSSGDVYLARDGRLHGDAGEVVVKIFTSTLSPTVERRFQNEVRAARKIDNRHCVAVFDAGTHRGAPYLVMERVRGQNLRQWLHHHGNIGMAEVIELFEQVAEALVDVHAEGIVHRDLKPENLMVVREEPLFVKVLDFGVAHLADEGATFSGVGTPRYMAPEQALHEPVDARTDIYALGVCVYELLSGAPPFTGESVSELLRAKQDRAPRPLSNVAPSVPAHVARLVDSMIRRDPDARPCDMREVLRLLREPGASPVSRRLRKLRAQTVVVVALVAVGGFAVFASLGTRSPVTPGSAPTEGDASVVKVAMAAASADAADTPAIVPAPSSAMAKPDPLVLRHSRTPALDVPRGRVASSAVEPPAPAVTFRSGAMKADEL